MPRSASSTAAFLADALARFQQGTEATQRQRQRLRSDLRMYAGDQWDPLVAQARQGVPGNTQQSGQGTALPSVPARPTLTINRFKEPVRQVLNAERQSDFGIELVAADDFGDLGPTVSDQEVELREGLIRRIQRDSQAADARTWGFSRAVIGGEGYYVVRTRYAPGKSFDKDVYLERVFDQFSILLDPAHTQPDGSDATWAFIHTLYTVDAFEAEFGQTAAREAQTYREADDQQWDLWGEQCPGWYETTTADNGTRVHQIRVTEYFYQDTTTRTLCQLADGSVAWRDDLPEDTPSYEGQTLTPAQLSTIAATTPGAILLTRDVSTPAIKWAKLCGKAILDETEWEGPDMPIVKIVGEELHIFDSDRHTEGMIRPGIDSQRGFNAMVSKQVEAVAYAPIPPLQVDPDAIKGYETWYALANTRALPFLPSKSYDAQGRQLGPVHRTDTGADIEGIAQSVMLFNQAMQWTTAVPQTATGQSSPDATSGRAIRLLQDAAEQGTSNYLDNLKRSMRYEGQIINNLLYPIYGKRPGRLARIINSQGDTQTVAVNASPQTAAPPTGARTYTLSPDARFSVAIKIARNFETRREQESTFLGELIAKNPLFMGWYGDVFFKNFDIPGHQELAERARVMLDPKIQSLIDQKQSGQQPLPPTIVAKMAAMQGQLQHAEQVIGAAQQERHGKQMELQSKEKIEAANLAWEREKFQKEADLKLALAHIAAKTDALGAAFAAHEERVAAGIAQIHEAEQAALDRIHERQMAQGAQDHALALGAAGAGAEADAAASDQAHQQQMAATAPAPEGA